MRWARTPVRRARGLDDTRESTLSHSPVTRSSSIDSLTRDAPPVNFSVALDPEDKVKERPVTDDKDEDGDHKNVLAAQYQLFRQAVMTSKGSFKVKPTGHTGHTGHRFWIWVTVRLQIGYLGWTRLLSRTRWLRWPKGSRKMKMSRIQCYQRH